jgi:gamma-D-glutamyl-L-lysine dipeptidyl-peptidase
VRVAAIRAEPADDAEQVTQALLDEPLEVDERRDGWVRVLTAYGSAGWIRGGALSHGDGTLPAATGQLPFEAARRFLGAPYEWGGLTAAGIDCSGLVHVAYRLTGRLVPRDAWQQEAAATAIAPGDERPGDLVVYGATERADHVAFWLDERRILHATARESLGVVEEEEPDELRASRRGNVRL